MHVYVDADACPVKQEVLRVAARYGLEVTLVANSWLRIPQRRGIRLQLVPGGLDAADDWIAENVQPGDVVVTNDIPLASRCLEAGAEALAPDGRRFTADNIGQALATRDLLWDLRGMGEVTGGPAPMTARDRGRFLQQLDEIIQRRRRTSETRPLPAT